MKKKTIIIIGAIVIVAVVAVVLLFRSGKHKLMLNSAVVEEGVVEVSATATGYVQPVDKVDVGTQVSGVIEKIFVDFNTQVKKGQLLAELDKSTLLEKLTQTNANLSSAKSDLTFAQQSYERTKLLYDSKAATPAAYEDAVNRLEQAKNAVANAKANVHQAEVNLSYAEIYSPIDGVVLNRAVEEGQTVAASFSTPTLFTIANDLTKMQVEANVDEADIGSVKVGQSVNFTVDSYPDDVFSGVVNQIRLQPTVTSNVVTYTVIIEAPNPEEKLFPGMTANVTIVTKQQKGICIPLEASQFTPSPEVLATIMTKNDSKQQPEKGNNHDKHVWIKTADGMEPRLVQTGINDGVNIIITNGLKVGDTIVISASLEKISKKSGQAAPNPFMPQRQGKR